MERDHYYGRRSATAKEETLTPNNERWSRGDAVKGTVTEEHPAFQTSLRGDNGSEEPAGQTSARTVDGALKEMPPVSVPGIDPRPSKRCLILAHRHGPLVTLHAVECWGAELGLLAQVVPSEVEALVSDVCELAGVPSLPVEFAWAPNRKHRKYLGWYCVYTSLPLFGYHERIVLNRANGGDTLVTLAHELAHHVVGVRRLRESGTPAACRYRPHGLPFPGTYREMVGYIHAQVTGRRDAPQ